MEGERSPQAINKEEAGAKFTKPRPHTYEPEEQGAKPAAQVKTWGRGFAFCVALPHRGVRGGYRGGGGGLDGMAEGATVRMEGQRSACWSP